MFDHVAIRASDRARSEQLYRPALAALELEPTRCEEQLVAWQDFTIAAAQPQRPATRHLHVAFAAHGRAAVDAFWHAGLRAGAVSDGEPGERAIYTPAYYGAFLLDPDGNSFEAVSHEDVRRGGIIDHLWIGVRDLDASSGFYETIAPHTGLREGRRWEAGRQFRGAWATFSLVADGRRATENLHVAFPAPDRATVHDFYEAAIAAGCRDNGPPGERPGCYAAFVLDPDGNNIESVLHEQAA
jgi:catechol 2,3-dioxygenase-like lactoylglutathione lyase family enzyme